MEFHATCSGCDELPKLAALSSTKVDGFERRVVILICKQEVFWLNVPPHHAMLVELHNEWGLRLADLKTSDMIHRTCYRMRVVQHAQQTCAMVRSTSRMILAAYASL